MTAVGARELQRPVGAGTDNRGFVYVADRGVLVDPDTREVVKFDTGGDVVQRIDVTRPGFDFFPNDVAVHPSSGDLFVAGDARIER